MTLRPSSVIVPVLSKTTHWIFPASFILLGCMQNIFLTLSLLIANAEPLDKAAGNAAGTAHTKVLRNRAPIVSGLDSRIIN